LETILRLKKLNVPWYTTAMMQPRTLRIIAYVLIFIIGTIALEGYDVISGLNIMDQFYHPISGLFG